MSRRTIPLIAFLAGLSACGIAEAPFMPLADDALLAKPPSGPTDPTATFLFPTDDSTLGVLSDGQFLNGANSVYAEGVCGVQARIFATTAASNSGDATMQTYNPRTKDRTCSTYPRTLTILYGDGVQQTGTVFINVRGIANTTYQIPVGETKRRGLHINEGRCNGLVWQAQLGDGTETGVDSVNVTRLSKSSWLVETQPADSAYCKATGQKFGIAARFTIVSSDSLPVPPSP